MLPDEQNAVRQDETLALIRICPGEFRAILPKEV
jgi:hypothetical protein